jgi:hypothetical protein
MSRALVPTVSLLVHACVLGCGAPDRPPPASDANEGDVDAPALTARALDDEGQVCEPGTWRECRIYYLDDRGQMQCPNQSQFCRADGRGWLACGVRELAEAR